MRNLERERDIYRDLVQNFADDPWGVLDGGLQESEAQLEQAALDYVSELQAHGSDLGLDFLQVLQEEATDNEIQRLRDEYYCLPETDTD